MRKKAHLRRIYVNLGDMNNIKGIIVLQEGVYIINKSGEGGKITLILRSGSECERFA